MKITIYIYISDKDEKCNNSELLEIFLAAYHLNNQPAVFTSSRSKTEARKNDLHMN